MPCWPVSLRDGVYQVTDVDGIHYPITMGRMPVEKLNPGWYPVGLQTGLRPFHLLELRNDEGPVREAVWFLSDELDFVANAARHFSPEHAALVAGSLSPLLRDIFDQTLCAPSAGVAESTHAFDGINPAFVQELIGLVVDAALSPPDVVAVHRLGEISSHYMAGDIRLSASLLRHCLDIETPEALRERLAVASPFDASLVTAQDQFAPGGGVLAQAYRFHDPAGQAAFYLLFQAGGAPEDGAIEDGAIGGGAPALYIPVMNTVFAAQDGLSGAEVMTALLTYYASHTGRAPQAPDLHAPEPPQPETPDGAAPQADRPAPDGDATADGDAGLLPAHDSADAPHTNWWKRLFGLGNS